MALTSHAKEADPGVAAQLDTSTIDTLSGGRFRLGIGTQVRTHVVRRYGAEFEHPGPRLRDHVLAAADPAKYRTKDEVQKMRSERDPIEQVKARVIEQKWATEDELKAIDKEVRAIVADAAEFAQNDPEPDVSELYTDILLEA